jgi:hypothetical protein
MRFFLCLLLVFFPCSMQAKEKSSQAKERLAYDKQTVLDKASKHYENAISELKKTKNISWYIPDPTKQRHLEALIGGALSAIQSKNVREGVLMMAIPLISVLIFDANGRYAELHGHLKKAEYHMEMAKFYNTMFLNKKTHESTNKGTKAFFSGIDYLTLAMLTAQSIDPSYDCIIANKNGYYTLASCRKSFIENQDDIANRGYTLYENIDEIMSECRHCFKKDITEYIGLMVDKFEEAENLWKTKKQREKDKINDYINNLP